jgi:hypothetical protein
VEQLVKELLSSLFQKRGEFNVLICPVTIGKSLAVDQLKGAVVPFNLHVPVVYSFVEYADVEIQDLERVCGEHAATLGRLRRRRLCRMLRRRKIAREDSALSAAKLRLNDLTESLSSVKHYLNPTIIYRDGSRVSGPNFGADSEC